MGSKFERSEKVLPFYLPGRRACYQVCSLLVLFFARLDPRGVRNDFSKKKGTAKKENYIHSHTHLHPNSPISNAFFPFPSVDLAALPQCRYGWCCCSWLVGFLCPHADVGTYQPKPGIEWPLAGIHPLTDLDKGAAAAGDFHLS